MEREQTLTEPATVPAMRPPPLRQEALYQARPIMETPTMARRRPNPDPRPPNDDGQQDSILMWRSKFLAFISSFGYRLVTKAADKPRDGWRHQRVLGEVSRKMPQEIRRARAAFGLMMESITAYLIIEFRVQIAISPGGACEELQKTCMPKAIAARHRLKRDFDTVHTVL